MNEAEIQSLTARRKKVEEKFGVNVRFDPSKCDTWWYATARDEEGFTVASTLEEDADTALAQLVVVLENIAAQEALNA